MVEARDFLFLQDVWINCGAARSGDCARDTKRLLLSGKAAL